MKKIYLIIIIGISIGLLAGCKGRPKDVLSEKKIVELLADLELAQSYSESHYEYKGDSLRKVLRQSVMKKHGVTEESLDKSLDWYGNNIEKFVALQDKVIAKLKEREKSLISEDNDLLKNSDWPYPVMVRVAPLSPNDAFTFSMGGGEVQKGDVLVWSGYMDETGGNARLLIGVDYVDGATSYKINNLNQGKFEAELQTDSTKEVARIFGYIRNNADSRKELRIDSLAFGRRPLDNTIYHKFRSQGFYTLPGSLARSKMPISPVSIMESESEIVEENPSAFMSDKPVSKLSSKMPIVSDNVVTTAAEEAPAPQNKK